MINKLRKKFIIITMIAVIIVIVGIVSGINIFNYNKINTQADQIIQILVNNNGVMPTPNTQGGIGGEPKEFENSNLSIETPFKTRYFTVIETETETFVNINSIYSVSVDDALNYVKIINKKIKKTGYYNYYKYAKVVKDSQILYIFIDCEEELLLFKNVQQFSINIGVGAVLIIFILIMFFSKIAVKPIAESYDKQKRFITDANHELKTPLTIIGASNEILEMQYGKNEWIDSINNQVKRLTDLTEQLVILSRMQEGEDKFVMSNISLSAVCNELASSFIPLSTTQNKQYKINIEPNIETIADKNLTSRLISILLDNAFKYTNENDIILFTLQSFGKHIKLTVKNTVDEIEKGNLNYLFERFYRLDKSRNSSTGGSGIGLSVAKAIADIHKWKILAKSEDGKSIQFEVLI